MNHKGMPRQKCVPQHAGSVYAKIVMTMVITTVMMVMMAENVMEQAQRVANACFLAACWVRG